MGAVSFEAELEKARALRVQADEIVANAFATRPLPDKWRVGQTVRYVRTEDQGFSKGMIAYVHRLSDDHAGKPAAEYQVFWTGPKDKSSTWWTTPDDVELVQDVKSK